VTNFRSIFVRLYRSAVVWSWLFNGLRLSAGLLLLPLLALKLSKPDLGMYIIFLNLGALVPILDFGFSASIGRNVSHAMGGATEFKTHGIYPSGKNEPNYPLLWQLLKTTRRLYRFLSLSAVLLLGILGSAIVGMNAHETDSPSITWLAWGISLVAFIWEIYSGWWNVFLRGTNQVLLAAKFSVSAYALQLLLACILLLLGGGLLSVPIASLVSNCLQRFLARRACLSLLQDKQADNQKINVMNLLTVLWPSSWRTGVQFISAYLSGSVSIFICSALFGLEASAQYGLSVRIIAIAQGMASVWMTVKWPHIGQLRAQGDFPQIRRIFFGRLWLQILTFIFLGAIAVIFSPFLLKWIGSDKEVLPPIWFSLLALNSLLEMNYSVWGTLIFLENRMPYLWPVVIANAASIALALVLINTTELKWAAFVIAPLSLGILFNYWRWPVEGAKALQTSWLRFMFSPVR
jgi:O-antigen/teichoic acid export membrane protein